MSEYTELDSSKFQIFQSRLENYFNNLFQIISLECEDRCIGKWKIELEAKYRAGNRIYSKSIESQKGFAHFCSYRFDQPVLDILKRTLDFLVNKIEFCFEGIQINPLYFILQPVNLWKSFVSHTPFENLGAFSGYCNLNCEFCYEHNTPLNFSRQILTKEEVRTRLKYYLPDKQRGLLRSFDFSLEPFMNPNLFNILYFLRNQYPYEMIHLVTNGSLLTKKVIMELANLKPIILSHSLNTANHQFRQSVMNDSNSHISISSISLLREYDIPFVATIVGWPSLPISDVENTIHFLDDNDALRITIHLPSYHKFSNFQWNRQEFHNHWEKLCNLVRQLRTTKATPLNVLPGVFLSKTTYPTIEGIYKNSPAYFAGIRLGDRIDAIDNIPVTTKTECLRILRSLRKKIKDKLLVPIDINRKGKQSTKYVFYHFPASCDLYPYKPKGYLLPDEPIGIFMSEDFSRKYIFDLMEIIHKRSAHLVLVISSILIRTFFEQTLQSINWKLLSESVKIVVEEVVPHFFGGNILLGDLSTVDDYISAVDRGIIKMGSLPDIIVLPSSFLISSSPFDIMGNSYRKIETQFGVPVELISCSRIAN